MLGAPETQQCETLCERVDTLIRSHRGIQTILASNTTHEKIRELITRTEGLEQAVREIALEVECLAAAHEREAE